jgi:hypothetical protein
MGSRILKRIIATFRPQKGKKQEKKGRNKQNKKYGIPYKKKLLVFKYYSLLMV